MLAVSMPAIARAMVQTGSKSDYMYIIYRNPLVVRRQGLNTSGIDGAHSADS